MTAETLKAVIKGLDYLATKQADDGSWIIGGGQAYPVAMTGLAGTAMLAHGNSPTRGKYSRNLQGAVEFLVRCATPTGLITGPTQDSGQPMHGHGFALMFLACVYGMITKESLRQQVQSTIRKAVTLTSQGQSAQGGWTYIPGARRRRLGDGHPGAGPAGRAQRGVPGSASRHRGIGEIPRALPDHRRRNRIFAPLQQRTEARHFGGRRRDLVQRRPVRQHHRHRLSQVRLGPVPELTRDGARGAGHDFYTHLYASQGFYMAGDQYWDKYFPGARDQLLAMQSPDGSWQGDGIGEIYGTSIATIILQLPYKYLPIFQRECIGGDAILSTATVEIDLAELEELRSAYNQIREQIARQIVGQTEVVDQLLIAVFARGHCILEGVPGLAKTLMVHSLAQSLSLEFTRIQFTPDLMPSDITGTEMLYEDRQSGARELRFVRGPIFANLILADEINRTPPKTQAALLEAMQERQVTAGGHKHTLPDPFFVLATQNPIEQEGTYPLPEAQLDRFLFKIFITYPTPEEERRIYRITTGADATRDHADARWRTDRGVAAAGEAGADLGPLHRLRDGPRPGDPRPRSWRAQVYRATGWPGAPGPAPVSR